LPFDVFMLSKEPNMARGKSDLLDDSRNAPAEKAVAVADVESGQWVRVGTMDSCACQNVAVAGIMFPRRTEPLVKSGQETKRAYERGQVLWLSDRKLEEIKAKVGNYVQRWNGKEGRIYNKNSSGPRRFNQREGDEPLVSHIYIEPVDGPPSYTPESIDWSAINQRNLLAR
jgi:hypothetical protein